MALRRGLHIQDHMPNRRRPLFTLRPVDEFANTRHQRVHRPHRGETGQPTFGVRAQLL